MNKNSYREKMATIKLFELTTHDFQRLLNLFSSFKSQKSVTIYNSNIKMVSKDGTYIFSNIPHFFCNQGITAKFNTNKTGLPLLKQFLDDPANIEFYQDTVTGEIKLQQGSQKKTLPLPKNISSINTDDFEQFSPSATLGNHFINSFDRSEPIKIELDNRQIKRLYQKFSYYKVKTENWIITQNEYIPSGDLIFEPAEFLPFEADSFEISICTDDNSEPKLITSYVIDGFQVFAYGGKKEETKKEKEKKEKENEAEKKYKDRFPLTYNQWEKFGFYAVLPELKKKDRIITDIAPTNYDKLLRYLEFFSDHKNLNIVDGILTYQVEVLIQADLGGLFTGGTKGVTFLVKDVREFVKKLMEVFGTDEVDSIPSLLTSRSNIVVVEKDIEPVASDEPVGLDLPFETINKHLYLFSSLPIPRGNIDYKIRKMDLMPVTGNQKSVQIQNLIPISNNLYIPNHVKQSLSRNNRFVLISLFGSEITCLQSKVDQADHGITIKYSNEIPAVIFQSDYFLRYEADEYRISIIEKNGYWLETTYTLAGQPIKTYEELKRIK
jgi:hypothetical protein